MRAYRVFPHLEGARPGQPGHALYLPASGAGRWDNPDLYALYYLALEPSAAVGEAFGSFASWHPDLLMSPSLPGAERKLGTYEIPADGELFNLDDGARLAERGIRPSEIVRQDNRPRTQAIARTVFEEGGHAGLLWWSARLARWSVAAVWETRRVSLLGVESLHGSEVVAEAAAALPRAVRAPF